MLMKAKLKERKELCLSRALECERVCVYSDINYFVSVAVSEQMDLTCGVPQGSFFEPPLFRLSELPFN